MAGRFDGADIKLFSPWTDLHELLGRNYIPDVAVTITAALEAMSEGMRSHGLDKDAIRVILAETERQICLRIIGEVKANGPVVEPQCEADPASPHTLTPMCKVECLKRILAVDGQGTRVYNAVSRRHDRPRVADVIELAITQEYAYLQNFGQKSMDRLCAVMVEAGFITEIPYFPGRYRLRNKVEEGGQI